MRLIYFRPPFLYRLNFCLTASTSGSDRRLFHKLTRQAAREYVRGQGQGGSRCLSRLRLK